MNGVALGPALSQTDPALRPFDIDDCWVVAGMQACRGVGADITGLTIPQYRKAAGRPDNAHAPNPGGAADVARGASNLYPTLRVKLASTAWLTFRAAVVKQGKLAVLLVLSARLAPEHRYAFLGPHALTVRFVTTADGGRWYGVNPLQPKGSRPQVYTERELRDAAEAYPAGVQATLFAPPIVVPPPLPVPDETPYSQADLDDARASGYADGVQAAIDAAEALL
jgi:hypothetical protein